MIARDAEKLPWDISWKMHFWSYIILFLFRTWNYQADAFSRVYYRRWTRDYGGVFLYSFTQQYIFPFRCAQMRFLCTHSGVFRLAGVRFNGFVRIVARFYGTIWIFNYVESTSEKKRCSLIFSFGVAAAFSVFRYSPIPVLSVERMHDRCNTVYILPWWYIR